MYSGTMLPTIPTQVRAPDLIQFIVDGKPRYVRASSIDGARFVDHKLAIAIYNNNGFSISDPEEIKAAVGTLNMMSSFEVTTGQV